MANYLISFPSAAMVLPDGESGAVGRDAHAVIARIAKACRCDQELRSSGSTRSPKGSLKWRGKCGLTIHSSRTRFAGRYNSGVRVDRSTVPRGWFFRH